MQERLVAKLAMLIDQAEKIYLEAWAKQPAEFFQEPLWYTWTFKHFRESPSQSVTERQPLGSISDHAVDTLPPLLHQHVLHLSLLTGLSQVVSSPESSFDECKLALERWLALSRGGERWEAVREWEELIDLELTGYGLEDEESSEEEVKPKRKGKGSKR